MSNENATTGFCLAVCYWIFIFATLFLPLAIIAQPSANERSFAILYGIFPSLVFAVAAATPMFVARANGGKLVSRRFFQKLIEKSESSVPQKVTNPFGD